MRYEYNDVPDEEREEPWARELAWAAFMACCAGNGKYGWKDFDLFGDDGENEDLELSAKEPEGVPETLDTPDTDGGIRRTNRGIDPETEKALRCSA